MNLTQLAEARDRETFKRLTAAQRAALAALGDGPALASHPTRAGRYWTLYALPITRTTMGALLDRHLVAVTSIDAGDSATITEAGRAVLTAGQKGRG